MTRTALYTGSFDPVTNGHLDVVRQAFQVADRLVVAIGVHSSKAPSSLPRSGPRCWTPSVGHWQGKPAGTLEVVTFYDLAVEAARRHGATLIVRGLRDGTDFDYEIQMAVDERHDGARCPDGFLRRFATVRPITATLVRQIAAMGGDVSRLRARVGGRRLRRKFERR